VSDAKQQRYVADECAKIKQLLAEAVLDFAALIDCLTGRNFKKRTEVAVQYPTLGVKMACESRHAHSQFFTFFS
jgi:hypothetical protein